jgi:hypothetical protein
MEFFHSPPLACKVSRNDDDRLQIIIPRAGTSILKSNVYSGKLVIVHTKRQENDAVIIFDLFPVSQINLKKNSDQRQPVKQLVGQYRFGKRLLQSPIQIKTQLPGQS